MNLKIFITLLNKKQNRNYNYFLFFIIIFMSSIDVDLFIIECEILNDLKKLGIGLFVNRNS